MIDCLDELYNGKESQESYWYSKDLEEIKLYSYY